MALRLSDAAVSSAAAEEIAKRPNLFAQATLYVSEQDERQMREIIAAVEKTVGCPDYQERVLSYSGETARFDPKARGVFFGYDFHLTAEGPKLIEINTNAGGAFLNLLLLQSAETEEVIAEMFLEEWRKSRPSEKPETLAIVDEDCAGQFLYPEFLLFQDFFNCRGIKTVVADAASLSFKEGRLYCGDLPLDFVYNRLTDFSLENHQALKEAYLSDSVVLTPHPRAHALYAQKKNLSLLTDRAILRQWQIDEATIALLQKGIPGTLVVKDQDPEKLWSNRRHLFFKPSAGFGAKAAYRGDKITKRVWEEILAGDYVSQEFAPPGEISMDGQSLKYDIRNYVYEGKVQLLAARLYQGQTTNFRTPGGGFARVVLSAKPAIIQF